MHFPEPTEFGRVKLHFYAGNDAGRQYVPLGFEVQVQRGDRWVRVARVENNADVSPEITLKPVTAEALRVLFTVSCPADDIVRLCEIEVHPAP